MSGPLDRQTRLALELLRAAGDRPVRLTELKAAGIERPGTVVYELQLAGHPIELLPGAVRLGSAPQPPADPLAGRSRWRRALAADPDGLAGGAPRRTRAAAPSPRAPAPPTNPGPRHGPG